MLVRRPYEEPHGVTSFSVRGMTTLRYPPRAWERPRMPAIDAKARKVRELLGGKEYTIDYFQCEYRWRTEEDRRACNGLDGAIPGSLEAKPLDDLER